MQRGPWLEQTTAKFTWRFFMNDFVFLNPKYYRAGHEKELADLLLVLDDTCIIISLKGTDGTPKSKTKLKNWLAKKALEGSRQARGGITWISRVPFGGLNLWGEIRQFEPDSLRPICGIVLLECSQKPFGPVQFTTPNIQSNVPLHFLSLNDFLNVVDRLGSIWDVFDYFSKRAAIGHVFTGINQEQPILAYYSLRSQDLTGILSTDKAELIKLRESYLLHLHDNRAEYEERERMALNVNAIVHELHTRHPSPEDYLPAALQSYLEPMDKRVAYLRMAAMLNGLPMSNKVFIGRKLENILANLRNSGGSECFGFKPLKKDLVFVFACFSKLTCQRRWKSVPSGRSNSVPVDAKRRGRLGPLLSFYPDLLQFEAF